VSPDKLIDIRLVPDGDFGAVLSAIELDIGFTLSGNWQIDPVDGINHTSFWCFKYTTNSKKQQKCSSFVGWALDFSNFSSKFLGK
jgi:hypothetical protein